MIIYMKLKGVNLAMLEANRKALERYGYDVHIKNGDGRYIIAALGELGGLEGFFVQEKLVGVEKIDQANQFFDDNHEGFKEAWFFFAGIDAGGE